MGSACSTQIGAQALRRRLKIATPDYLTWYYISLQYFFVYLATSDELSITYHCSLHTHQAKKKLAKQKHFIIEGGGKELDRRLTFHALSLGQLAST